MAKKKIIITPESHWDREWYLPFQEYRAKLVILMDDLLKLYENNPEYANFTMDGQTIPIEDYLEVKPSKEDKIHENVQNGKLSIGPMYILPDLYLVSGESMIRNLMLGHKIGNKYGRVMKAGYIPDPFGHFAQMPQLLAGFKIPSILFARGFGDEFEKLGLDMEFNWQAPGNAANILGIHLVKGYGSLAGLDETIDPKTGKYENALNRMKRVVDELSEAAQTNAIILNNGTDHRYAQPNIPEVIKQWNERYGDDIGTAEQADFEKYIDLVLAENPDLKTYQGELHGGKYQYLLSGVYSARIWIKQWNKLCENQLERYSEPFAAITKLYDTTDSYEYPVDYLWTAWRWLLKNHPHDSICGCSVDYVHDVDMRARFGWAEQIGMEIVKNAAICLTSQIDIDTKEGERFPIIVYNPTPWKSTSLISVPVISNENMLKIIGPEQFIITDSSENEVFYFASDDELPSRYIHTDEVVFSLNFIAEDIPACGIKTFYLVPGEESEMGSAELKNKVASGAKDGRHFIENQFYKIFVSDDGSFDVYDKELNTWFKNQGILEDVGDWGDEYDFSGPKDNQKDTRLLSTKFVEDINVEDYDVVASIEVYFNLNLPIGLTETRDKRTDDTIESAASLFISLNSEEKIIYVDIIVDNESMDHRLRVLFSSGLQPKDGKVHADGHFYVVPRDIKLPKVEDWSQNPVPTHHQNNFVSVNDGNKCFAVMNRGLPEYEPILNEQNNADLAITLFRSVGWLSRGDFATRSNNAGPPISAPGAQCLGIQEFGLALTTGKGDWLQAKVHKTADQFNCPPQPINPFSIRNSLRMCNAFEFNRLNNVPQISPDDAPLQDTFSVCELRGDNFMLTSLKRADREADSFIIRLVNLSEEKSDGSLILGKPIDSAEIVNLNEESLDDNDEKFPVKASILNVGDNQISFTAEAHVILTLKLKFKG